MSEALPAAGVRSASPRPGLDKGLCAEPTIQCIGKALGSRRQRLAAPGSTDGVAGCITSWASRVRTCEARDRSPVRSTRDEAKVPSLEESGPLAAGAADIRPVLFDQPGAQRQRQRELTAIGSNVSEGITACEESPTPPRAGLDKGLCAEPTWQNLRKSFGSRRQRSPSHKTSSDLAACLSPRQMTRAAETRARSVGSPRRPDRQSPGDVSEYAEIMAKSMHALHAPDNVPLPPFTENVSPLPRRAHRPEEEFEIDVYRSTRVQPAQRCRSASPFGRNVPGEQCGPENFVMVGKEGRQLASKGHFNCTRPFVFEDIGAPLEEEVEGAHLFYASGSKDAPFNAFSVAPSKRHVPVPGETLPPADNPESPSGEAPSAERLVNDDAPVRAAGVASPTYERAYGVVPRQAEDVVFRTESKLGSRRHDFSAEASTCCTPSWPSGGPKDLAKGLSPEPTQLCLERMLGERRRKSGSPWASPGTSPWGSPHHSPRQLSPRSTEPQSGGAIPWPPAVGGGEATTLPSWRAVATFTDGIDEAVETSSPIPTRLERPTTEARLAAVTINRHGSPVTAGSAGVAPRVDSWKFRGRELNLRKGQAASKLRWR